MKQFNCVKGFPEIITSIYSLIAVLEQKNKTKNKKKFPTLGFFETKKKLNKKNFQLFEFSRLGFLEKIKKKSSLGIFKTKKKLKKKKFSSLWIFKTLISEKNRDLDFWKNCKWTKSFWNNWTVWIVFLKNVNLTNFQFDFWQWKFSNIQLSDKTVISAKVFETIQ